MDPQPNIGERPAIRAAEADSKIVSSPQSASPSASGKTAAGNAPRTEEDNGRSLAALAYRDLDAALQLLAERAQYITGASGAMIALCRSEHNDMLCRARAGSNAPELGALLSMEYGFSGESVRTRQALRCDDAEHDSRVNRDACRQLGVSSVVAIPILSNQQVLGVFELFSDKPRAFAEHDLSALRRLSEMVETAVKYAVAAQADVQEIEPIVDEIKLDVETVAPPATLAASDVLSVPTTNDPPISESANMNAEKTDPALMDVLSSEEEKVNLPAMSEPPARKPLFWSAAMQTQENVVPPNQAAEFMSVPSVLRNLQKCQACGFPISQGRTFCVECEDKQWRGQPMPRSSGAAQVRVNRGIKNAAERYASDSSSVQIPATLTSAAPTSIPAKESTSGQFANPVAPVVAAATPKTLTPAPVQSAAIAQNVSSTPQPISASDNPVLFLASAAQSQSWFASNKYILGTLVLAAVIIAAIVLLR
jgi:hypothetical protein